jgi:hypothetical protein
MTSSAVLEDPAATSPRVGRGRRRAAVWVAVAVILVLVGAIGAVLADTGRWSERTMLDPDSAGPDGGRALARILGSHGVDVEIVRTRADAAAALGGRAATLVLLDSPYLSDRSLTALADAATDVVVVQPHARAIRLLLPGDTLSDYGPDEPTAPRCDLPAAMRAGAVAPGALFDAAGGGCYPVEGSYGLVWRTRGEGTVAAVDGTVLFTNEHLADDGNAALAVNLLGRLPTVVWFVPDAADSDIPADATIGSLTPGWVSPVIVLLLVAGIAAGIWRGRRFGPLVAERLPVTVRGTETTEGRARLYARGRDAGHAADELRFAAIPRMARLLGLGDGSTVQAIAGAVAARTATDPAEVRRILFDETPTTDRQLVALADDLRRLETALRRAVRPDTPDTPERTVP